MMKHRFVAIDVVRIIAIILVVYTHFVLAGGGATTIPGVIAASTTLPILDASKWHAWYFEIFIIYPFSAESGTLGVTIFFIVTGYLMPIMMERYTRLQFLVNRFFRIIPVLFVAVILIGIFVYITQSITFTFASYLSSITLTYPIAGAVPVVGVLWTLVIEAIFYSIATMIGKFTFKKIIFLQVIILSIILFDVKNNNFYYLHLLSYNLRYVLMILIGSAIFLAQKNSSLIDKLIYISSSIVIAYVGFYIYQIKFLDNSTYNNIGTF